MVRSEGRGDRKPFLKSCFQFQFPRMVRNGLRSPKKILGPGPTVTNNGCESENRNLSVPALFKTPALFMISRVRLRTTPLEHDRASILDGLPPPTKVQKSTMAELKPGRSPSDGRDASKERSCKGS
jgi:hypothetical protein